MSKYQMSRKPSFKRPYKVHPIWNGLGVILIIMTPVLGFSAAAVLLEYGPANGIPLPYEMVGYPAFPDFLYGIPVIGALFASLSGIRGFYGLLVFGIVMSLVISGILSLVYSTLYRMIGPPRYTALDAPPPTEKATKKSR
jgi:hypothetical protein